MPDGTRIIRYPFESAPEPGGVIEVADGVFWIRMPLPMALDHVNLYALDDGDSWTLIDTGFGSRKSRALLTSVFEGPLAGKPVGRVLVTHHHPDHVGLAGWLQSAHGAELLMSRTAWLMARMLQLDEQPTPNTETLAFWQAAGMEPEILAQRANERPFNFADCVDPLPLGYSRIDEGDLLTMGGRQWRARLGSGHAPDHVTLWSESDELVIGGDQLLPSISPNIGVYATEPEADPVADWMDSCKRLKPFATAEQLVLPGHKLPFYGLPTRLDQLLENHVSALDRLEAHLTEPKSAGECFLPIFKRQVSGGEYGLALVESMAHCVHLWHQDRAIRQISDDGVWLWQAKG